VLGIGKPTLEDHAAYQRTMVRLRDARIVEEAACAAPRNSSATT